MKTRLSVCIVFLIILSSCAVVNNLYVNDPVPAGKDNSNIYYGIGSGFISKIDSISDNGTVHHQKKMILAPNFCFGTQAGLGEQTDLRVAFNIPYFVAGFGMRVGIQHSFFRKENPFNLAIGTDLGVGFSIDSILFIKFENPIKNTLNADLMLPMSYSFSSESRIILTPRASFNSIDVKDNVNQAKTKSYTPFIPSITLGVKVRRIYFEAGVHSVNHLLFPNFGIAYMLGAKKIPKVSNSGNNE